MIPFYAAEAVTLYLGDCIEVMRQMPPASVDAVVCDPPYNLSFMAKTWDDYGGPRVFQSWCNAWARAVSKAIDRAAGAEREVIGTKLGQPGYSLAENRDDRTAYGAFTDASSEAAITAPATDAARQWAGFGTALKPAYEPIVLARKPLIGTVVANVLQHDTGALNIDGTRIDAKGETWDREPGTVQASNSIGTFKTGARSVVQNAGGRWPANVLLDEEAAALLDASTPASPSTQRARKNLAGAAFGNGATMGRADSSFDNGGGFSDSGGAARFFYTAKASRSEREAGLDDLPVGLSERDSIAAWVNAVLEATHRADMDRLLERVTEGFGTAADYEWNTTSSGSGPTGPSKTESRSTTSTETSSTTPSKTSEPLTLQRTNAFILAALSRLESGSSPAVFAASVSRLIERTGTSTGKAPRSTTDVARVISEQLCDLSKKGGAPSRVIVRRNDHPT